MTTFADEFFSHFDENWQEVDMLMKLIDEMDDNDHRIKTYCRIISVLMVANLEGYLTEIVRMLIKDINYYGSFSSSNNVMKRTFCSQFIPDEKGNEGRLTKLVETFDGLNVKFNDDPFIFYNKNPKATVIDKLFSKVGGENFLGYISQGDIDDVFQNDLSENEKYIKELKRRIEAGIKSFPYDINLNGLGFNDKPKKIKECLWGSFINEILKNRHAVAHGMNFNGNLNINILNEQKLKIVILELVFTILLFNVAIARK